MLDAVRIGHPHFFDAMLFAAEEFGERTLALLVKHRRGVALEGERLAEPLLAFPRHRDDQPFRCLLYTSHIYAKLDVHSHQELIDLVERQG